MKDSGVSVGLVSAFGGIIHGGIITFVISVGCEITGSLPSVQLSDHVKITHLMLAWPARDLK